jgi:aminopeptidase N
MAATSSHVTSADWADLPADLLGENMGEGWRKFSFSPTPKMSTYLLCIVIGEYTATSSQVVEYSLLVHLPVPGISL